jgi:hypothetical protein
MPTALSGMNRTSEMGKGGFTHLQSYVIVIYGLREPSLGKLSCEVDPYIGEIAEAAQRQEPG